MLVALTWLVSGIAILTKFYLKKLPMTFPGEIIVQALSSVL